MRSICFVIELKESSRGCLLLIDGCDCRRSALSVCIVDMLLLLWGGYCVFFDVCLTFVEILDLATLRLVVVDGATLKTLAFWPSFDSLAVEGR